MGSLFIFSVIVGAFFASNAHAAEIVVAQVAPLSGPTGTYGLQTNLGASVLFSAVNSKGGVYGSRIRFVSRDDEMKVQKTLELFEEVSRVEKPVAFLYPIGPEGISALTMSSFAEKKAIPIIGAIPSAYKPQEGISPYTFHVGAGDDAEIAKIVEHVSTLGIRKIGVIHWSSPTGEESARIVQRYAVRHNIEITATATVEPGTALVDKAVLTIKLVQPGATIVFLPVDATGAFIRALREAKNTSLVYALSYNESSLLAKFIGEKYVQGVGVSQVVPNPFIGASLLLKEYQSDMRLHAPADTPLSSLSFEGYIAAKILVEAIRRAGPKVTGEAVKASLERLRGLDLGGLVVNYSPENHVALTYRNIGLVKPNGRIAY